MILHLYLYYVLLWWNKKKTDKMKNYWFLFDFEQRFNDGTMKTVNVS